LLLAPEPYASSSPTVSLSSTEILPPKARFRCPRAQRPADASRPCLPIRARTADTTTMVPSLADIRSNRRIMAYTAAAIYGIAGLDGAIEGLLPSDPPFALLPVIVVFVMFAVLMAFGPRLPRRALALLGPLGAVVIAYAVATS